MKKYLSFILIGFTLFKIFKIIDIRKYRPIMTAFRPIDVGLVVKITLSLEESRPIFKRHRMKRRKDKEESLRSHPGGKEKHNPKNPQDTGGFHLNSSTSLFLAVFILIILLLLWPDQTDLDSLDICLILSISSEKGIFTVASH